jgi:hypothetical protein
MPKGQGVDASIVGSTALKHSTRKRKESKRQVSNNKRSKDLALAIESGHQRESKLSALHLFLEFGDATEKLRAKQELHLIAFGGVQREVESDELVDDNSSASSSSPH